MHGKGVGEKKNKRRSIEPQRAGSCEEVRFVLVKLEAIWPASELVLEVIFMAAFYCLASAHYSNERVPFLYLPVRGHGADGDE